MVYFLNTRDMIPYTLYRTVDVKVFKFTHLSSKTNLFIDLRDKLHFMYGTTHLTKKT
jgi:hypothetical protein